MRKNTDNDENWNLFWIDITIIIYRCLYPFQQIQEQLLPAY
jgi:hypothetical protein